MEDNNFQQLLKNKLNNIDSSIKKNKFIEKKFEYKLKKKIFELLQELGGGIFGGAIRDQLLHEKGSKNFYSFYDQYTNNNTIICNEFQCGKIFIGKSINITYCDKYFHKDTYLDRNTIINDIDCVLNINQYERLIEKIKKIDNSIRIHSNKYDNFKKYINLNDPSKIIKSFMTIHISALNKYNQIRTLFSNNDLIDADIDIPLFLPVYFKIDIFFYDDDSNLFKALNLISSNSDYLCNSLYIVNNRISINDKTTRCLSIPNYESNLTDLKKKNIDMFLKKHIYITKMTNIIINQIYNREAYPIRCKIIQKRVDKMKFKNFKIINVYNFFENIKLNNEVCLLCRDNINNNEDCIRFICCNSCYHQSCFKEIVTRNKNNSYKRCYMCSSMINFSYIFSNYYI